MEGEESRRVDIDTSEGEIRTVNPKTDRAEALIDGAGFYTIHTSVTTKGFFSRRGQIDGHVNRIAKEMALHFGEGVIVQLEGAIKDDEEEHGDPMPGKSHPAT